MGAIDDPYAPPKAPIEAPRRRSSGEPDFRKEARSVALVVLLSVITVGFYPGVWYVRRQAFLDALDSDQKLGKALAWAPIVTFIVVVVLGVILPDDAGAGLGRALSGGAGAVSLMAALRTAHILRSHLARSGRLKGVSGAGAFFLGVWYLQHVINVAAETPARALRRKKKKKPAEPQPS